MAKKSETRTESHEVVTHNEAPTDNNTTGAAKTAGAASNKPIRVFRLRGVKAAIFENHAAENVFYKVSLQKIYREGEEWRTTTSLGRDDLPVARLLLDRAWEFILETEAQPATDGGSSHG